MTDCLEEYHSSVSGLHVCSLGLDHPENHCDETEPSFSWPRFRRLLQPPVYSEGLAMAMTLGAAMSDATDEQREQLRKRVSAKLPVYRRGRINEQFLRDVIQQVMGDKWAPTPKWAKLGA